MRQLESLPPVQYRSPMPPCVRMSPSSTVMLPGPTCFQPVRSLPSNSGFQAGACGRAAANASKVETAATISIVIHVRGFMAPFSSERSNQARGSDRSEHYEEESKLQVVKIVVAHLDVIEGGFRVVVFDEIMFNSGLAGVREKFGIRFVEEEIVGEFAAERIGGIEFE